MTTNGNKFLDRMTQPPLGGIGNAGRSTVMPPSPIGGLRCSDCHSNGGLVVSSAAQLGLDTVGITARFCVAARHDGAVFLHCGKGSAISHDVAKTALQLGLHGVRVTSKIFVAPRDDGAVFFQCSKRTSWSRQLAGHRLEKSDVTASELPPSSAMPYVTTEPSSFTAVKA